MSMQVGNQNHSVNQETISLIQHNEAIQAFYSQPINESSAITTASTNFIAPSLTEPELPPAANHDMFGLMAVSGSSPAASPSDVLFFPQMPNSPMAPQGPFKEGGFGSFVDLMAEIQSTLSMTGFWIKQVARFQGLAYGLAAADSLDKKAVQIEKGATDKLIGAVIGGVIQIVVAAGVAVYAFKQMNVARDAAKKRSDLSTDNSTSASASIARTGTSAQGNGSSAQGTGRLVDDNSDVLNTTAAVRKKAADAAKDAAADKADDSLLRGGARDLRREPNTLADVDTSNDVQVTGSIAQAFLQVGSAASAISNNVGEFMASKHEAAQVRLDADSTRYQAYSQAEEKFLSAGEKFAEDSLNTLSSIMQKVYDLNTQITQAFPR